MWPDANIDENQNIKGDVKMVEQMETSSLYDPNSMYTKNSVLILTATRCTASQLHAYWLKSSILLSERSLANTSLFE
jgi:hypothetical protein